MSQNLLLLDTHIWIWAINKEIDELSVTALNAIAKAESSRTLAISAISVWEVGMLDAKGRITCTPDCSTWVDQALSFPGLTFIPLTPAIAIQSSRLPGEIHGDPADRILVATCLQMNATLLTKDRKLLAYGADSHITVIPG
jgi:PIN domain nuclease of toxin-antitoxin system